MGEYEDVLYDDYAFPEAHPDYLLALGVLFGRHVDQDQPVRILDLGCGLGGHLLPLAEWDPRGRYVGIDASEPQIASGKAVAKTLGLHNVELFASDLRNPPTDLGRFDVVVCHGVYSWVDPEVQRSIWRLIRSTLAPSGMAYVSYNTMPGWRHRGTIREVLHHLVPPPAEASDRDRIAIARDALQIWKAAVQDRPSRHLRAIESEIDLLGKTTDAYLLYEHLAQINSPCWFSDVAGAASEHGLTYLSDALLPMMFPTLTKEVSEWMEARAQSFEAQEQLTDLLTQRLFRRSLFVHRGTPVDRELHWRRLEGLHLATSIRRNAENSEILESTMGTEVASDDPIVQLALELLADLRPSTIRFDQLCEAATGGTPSTPEKKRIGNGILSLITKGMVTPRLRFPPIANEVATTPIASPLARLQAANDEPGCVNGMHQRVALTKTDKAILKRLDGTQDREALITALQAEADGGHIQISVDGEVTQARAAVSAGVDLVLDRLRRSSFLYKA